MNHGSKQVRDDGSGAEGWTGMRLDVVIQATYLPLPTSAFMKQEHEPLKIEILEALETLMRMILTVRMIWKQKVT